MKLIVTICIAVYMIFMGSVVMIGFVQKQQKEAAITNSTTQPSVVNPQTNTSENNLSTTPTTPQPTTNIFTASQVATHNKPANCWITIHSNVYDVTSFLDQHPSGADVILPYCGKDATNAFETQDRRRGTHSQTARNLLAQYKVGTLQ